MASGVSRAYVTPVQIMTLSNGDCFEIVAASGLSETGLRNAIDSTLFKQWLKNMQSEKGLLAGGQMHLRRVEFQVLSCCEEAQEELIQQVLLFIVRNKSLGINEVVRFLRPFIMFSVMWKPTSCTYFFSRNLISEIASLSCSFPLEAIIILKFLTKCLKYFPSTNEKVPGIVFARGPSVAVLILLESKGVIYVVLTEQVRVPVGKLILEIPAGMVDDGGDVIGTAVREVEEETGINLKVQDMVSLTAFLDPGTGCRIFPSPGGCDEELSIFLYKGNAEEEVIKALQGKEMGLREHGELIKVHIVPYNKLWRITADAKALTAITLYEMARRDGLLP
ncbi:hypothetical protein KSP39_PZI007878 [Platanthera zijinensis]|uniref:Nudix hydrolase domain-containing protein n=1 Tax=Platanthera zijinensis TaxID=2320716 RepID=A0AAP0BLQ4_9ASPA